MLDTLECSRFEKAAEKLGIDLRFEQEEQKRNPLEAILEKFYQVNPILFIRLFLVKLHFFIFMP